MKAVAFENFFDGRHWHSQVRVEVDAAGKIAKIEQGHKSGDVYIDGLVLPGIVNAHSHAFQFAMALAAESRAPSFPEDNFWTWRQKMYDLANRISPEQMEAVASQVYALMLARGYTRVVEFHYLHHDRKGTSYANKAEMSLRILRAAQTAGIELTLVPIFYQTADFGMPIHDHQRRFYSPDVESYLQLVELIQKDLPPQVLIGHGAHSIRAADPSTLALLARQKFSVFHIHAAEQPKEVRGCLSTYGKRPVELICENFANASGPVALVHATHISPAEVREIANARFVAVLCPTTEASLGDGICPATELFDAGAQLAIGSDSHVCLDPFEELKLLEYGQRLAQKRRNCLVRDGQHVGASLLAATVTGGALASGVAVSAAGPLSVGAPANFVAMDVGGPNFFGKTKDVWLDTIVMGSPKITGTMVGGEWVVKDGVHRHDAAITKKFKQATDALFS
jgi:formimidoylglutamate deiminase